MIFTFLIIMIICFVLIKLLPNPIEAAPGAAYEIELARREALGYGKPIIEQLFIYAKNIITKWDWGVSLKIDYMHDVTEVVGDRLVPTLMINVYSLIFSIIAPTVSTTSSIFLLFSICSIFSLNSFNVPSISVLSSNISTFVINVCIVWLSVLICSFIFVFSNTSSIFYIINY